MKDLSSFKPTACIFDVDDTLISNYYADGTGMHEKARLLSVHDVAKKHNLSQLESTTLHDSTVAFLEAKEHTGMAATWRLLNMKGVIDDEEIDRSHPILTEILDGKDKYYSELLWRDGVEIRGAAQFVRLLSQHGVQLAIASGARRADINSVLTILGIEDYFTPDRIISHDDFQNAKPHPEPFELACKTLDLDTDSLKQVWAFEDDPKGIISAHAAGLRVCAVTSRFSKDKLSTNLTDNDIVIDNYDGLIAVLQSAAT